MRPEATTLPPGAAPRVTVRVEGTPTRVRVRLGERTLGVLFRSGDVWEGRVFLPKDAPPTLPLLVTAELDGREVARLPFFLGVNPQAPWGVLRAPPLAAPGQEVPVLVHWYAPVTAARLEAAGQTVPLEGTGADWRGRWVVPRDAPGRVTLRAVGVLPDGSEVVLERSLVVRAGAP